MADLESAKKRLIDVLKDKAQRYWDLMKSWYRRRISKDEFDSKVRSLLGEGNIHIHNEFLFAILVKCQVGSPDTQPSPHSVPSGRPSRGGSKRPKLASSGLVPYGALDPLQYHTPTKVQIIGKDLDTLLLCSHELMLPDKSTLHTRMLLGAWEAGLDGVSEESAEMLLLALQYQLKMVLQAMVSQRSSWCLRDGGFPHAFGHGPSNPATLSPGVTDKLHSGEMKEIKAVMGTSRSGHGGQLEPLNLLHLRDALRVQQQCIPVHSVYICTVERVLGSMWHASREEEEQRAMVEQWRRSLEPQKPFLITAGQS